MNSAPHNILTALSRISRISNAPSIDFNTKLQQMLSIILGCMNCRKGSIMIIKGHRDLEMAASSDPELIGIHHPLAEDSPASWVVRHRKNLFKNPDTSLGEISTTPDRYTRDAFLVAPIITGNTVMGVISVTEKTGPDRFSRQDQELFLALTGHIISALKIQKMADSLEKSRETLHRKNNELKKLEKIRADLFNMLIHDLKGPISEIVANLDILSYTSDPENREYVESARSGCDTLHRMTSNLLDIARLEEGSLQLIYERLQPESLISESVSGLHSLAGTKNIQLRQAFSPSDARPFFSGDRNILLRVIQNLLINAIQYSPAGATVNTGYELTESGHIVFFVKDNGPGIPRDLQKSIFDKFFQIEASRDGRKYSTGLGLTFCKLAVEAHNGKIYIEDNDEQGCCFKLMLPI